MRTSVTSPVLAAVVGLVACGGGPGAGGETAARVSTPLQGAADAGDPFSVALCEGPSPGQCTLRCSGTLVAPSLVLTARHCATPTPLGACSVDSAGVPSLDPATFWVTASPSLATVASNPAAFARGKAWAVPASTAACGADLALLTLASPLSSPTASPLFDGAALRAEGAGALAIGYGGSPAQMTGGVRSSVSAPLVCVGGEDACRAYADGSTLQPGEFVLDAQVCPGDSGGGAFVGGDVAGVLSRTLASTGACGTAVYTSLGAHALLLARTARAAAAAGEAPPAWVDAAERAGNGGAASARALGAPCDGDADCDSGACRSADFGRAFVCATPCPGGACPGGSACQNTELGAACFAAPSSPPRGCSTARDSSGGALAALVAVAGACVRRRRRTTPCA